MAINSGTRAGPGNGKKSSQIQNSQRPGSEREQPNTTKAPASFPISSSLEKEAARDSQLLFENATDLQVSSLRNSSPKPENLQRDGFFANLGTTKPPLLNRKTRRRIAKCFRKLFALFKFTTSQAHSETPNNEGNADNVLTHNTCETSNDRDDFKNDTSNPNKDPRAPDGMAQLGASQRDSWISESDRHSCNSDVLNKWQIYCFVENMEGRVFRVLVQFDTGSGSSFISRETLKMLGSMKPRPIPVTARTKYISPVNSGVVEPTEHVLVKLWNDELEFRFRNAKLRILEGSEVFKIIIGRKLITNYNILMRENGRPSLDTRLMALEDEDVPAESEVVKPIAALFKEKRTKAHQVMDKTKDEEDQKAFLEREKSLASSSTRPVRYTEPGSSSTVAGVSDLSQRHSATTSPTITVKSPVARRSGSQQPRKQGATNNVAGATDDSIELEQCDVGNSAQYTEYTDYSFGLHSSTSTISSVDSSRSCVLKPHWQQDE